MALAAGTALTSRKSSCPCGMAETRSMHIDPETELQREIRRLHLAALLRVEAMVALTAAELGLARLEEKIRTEGRALEAAFREEFPDEDERRPGSGNA
jgi:hypothetical protein